MSNLLHHALDVQVRDPHGTSDYSLALSDIDVSVTEVFDALGLPGDTAIDGQVVTAPASTRAIEVLNPGSQLSAPQTPADPDRLDAASEGPATAAVEVAIVGGLQAGQITQLSRGLYRLGGTPESVGSGWYLEVGHRSLEAEAAPWHQHATHIQAAVDAGLGVAIGRPVDSEAGSTGYVHRPPRALPPDSVAAIEIVDAPARVQPPSALSWATLLAPIPIAVMMAFFFRPIFALFAAMGPIMALGRWYESKRKFRRDTAKRDAAVAALVLEVAAAATAQAEAEASRRWLASPHVAELWRRARCRSVRLWERRPGVAGYLVATAGIATAEVDALTDGSKLDPEVHSRLSEPLATRVVPHTVDLAANTGVGIHGCRLDALAVARSLVLQLATLHGPADMRVGVLCDRSETEEWDWVKWLPHADDKLTALSARSIAKHVSPLTDTATMTLVADKDVGAVQLIIVDSATADVAAIQRSAAAAASDVRFVVVALHPTLLPAACSSLIAVHGPSAELATPELAGQRTIVCPVGIDAATAASWARSLTPLVDPELIDFNVGADDDVSLLRLLNFSSADELTNRWSLRPASATPSAAIGVSDDGPFTVDLVQDGPHVLVAGTTGSGKSELLRSMVLGLATECPPEQLNFVLVDFKGGGAFDAVDRLPHVAGLITDLDEALVVRALSSLRSELHRRETLFRELGVSSFEEAAALWDEQRATEPDCAGESLARLVIVIDEFAALATDYAELLAAVIDLAARGRSLGMHLVLATQRPSGVVDQKIRANTNLRVALRVQDAFDSQDVIGVGDAADIDRRTPGRAIFSVGGDAPVAVQTAFAGTPDPRTARCSVRAHTLFGDIAPAADVARSTAAASLVTRPPTTTAVSTELDVLLTAIEQVSAARSFTARPLWSDPLPTSLDWIDLGSRALAADGQLAGATAGGVALGLVDLPERQVQLPWRWDPDSGALAIFGSSAESAGKALVSLGAALTTASGPCSTHLYIIDGAAGGTAVLEDLAHTGAYVMLTETDRIERTVRLFEASLAQRRVSRDVTESARMVLLIDNLAAVVSMYDDIGAAELVDRIGALARDGTPQRLHLALTARTARDVGHRLSQQIPHRLVMELADPAGYLAMGLKARELVPLPEMRAIDLATNHVVQLVEPPDVSTWSPSTEPIIDAGLTSSGLPKPIRSFPRVCTRSDLAAAAVSADGVLRIPVGIEARNLDDATLVLPPGAHGLVVATNGMGRSTVLRTIIEQIDDTDLLIDICRVAPAHSPLSSAVAPGRLVCAADELVELGESDRATVVVVDDADQVEPDMAEALGKLVAPRASNVRVLAATTPEFARSIRAWVGPLRHSGIGVLVGGTPHDGDLFGVRFDRMDGLGVLPGRGYLVVRGQVQAVQFGSPGPDPNAPHRIG